MQAAEKKAWHRRFAATCAPWLIYFAITSVGYFRVAVSAALAVILLFQSRNLRAIKAVDWAILSFFAFLFFGAVVFRLAWVNHYRGVFAPMVLAVLAFGSLAVGAPFTAQYAREQVEKKLWNNPHFIRVNRILTAVWGSIFVVLGIFALPCSAMQEDWVRFASSGALMIAGVLFTKWFPLWYRRNVFEPQTILNK